MNILSKTPWEDKKWDEGLCLRYALGKVQATSGEKKKSPNSVSECKLDNPHDSLIGASERTGEWERKTSYGKRYVESDVNPLTASVITVPLSTHPVPDNGTQLI